MMVENETVKITEDEAALYDRQIRLWGLDAQKRLRASKVLLIGLGGLGAEVAKNIVLSGIKSITLLDHREAKEEDACSQFLIDRTDLGKNRAECSCQRTQQLNPMVEVTSDTSEICSKDEEFFKTFHVVCATCCSQEELLHINDICHRNNILFFAGDVNGFYGYSFTDLNDHEYAEEVPQNMQKKEAATSAAGVEPPPKKVKAEDDDTKTVKKVAKFSRLKSSLSIDWASEDQQKKIQRTPSTYFIYRVLMEFRNTHGRGPDHRQVSADKESLASLRKSVTEALHVSIDKVPEDFMEFCFAELSPVCAVVGGVLGQEIIKAVSQRDAPHNNFFFYNALDGSGMVDQIG